MKTNENKPLNPSKIVKRLFVGISTALLLCVSLMGNYQVSTQLPYAQGNSPTLSNLTINYRPFGDGYVESISGNTSVFSSTPTQYYLVQSNTYSQFSPAYVTDADNYEVYHAYSGRWYNFPYEFVAEWNSNIIPIANYEYVKDYTLTRSYDVVPDVDEEVTFVFDYGILVSFATDTEDYNYTNEVLRATRMYEGNVSPISVSLSDLLPSIDLLRQNGAVLALSDGQEYINIKTLVFYEKRNENADFVVSGQEVMHMLDNPNMWTYADKIEFMGKLNAHISYVEVNPSEMLFQPLQAFLRFELMPGLSVQTLFVIALAIGIFGMFLKFYAGG